MNHDQLVRLTRQYGSLAERLRRDYTKQALAIAAEYIRQQVDNGTDPEAATDAARAVLRANYRAAAPMLDTD